MLEAMVRVAAAVLLAAVIALVATSVPMRVGRGGSTVGSFHVEP